MELKYGCCRRLTADYRFRPGCALPVGPSGPKGTPAGTLCRCAERTFERLAEGYLARWPPGEESFTDFNLHDIRREHGVRVATLQFTRERVRDDPGTFAVWGRSWASPGLGRCARPVDRLARAVTGWG